MKLFYGVPSLHPFASQKSKCPEIEGVAGVWWNCDVGVFLGCLVLVADIQKLLDFQYRLSPMT